MKKEAHTVAVLRVRTRTGEILFEKEFSADRTEGGLGAGILASPEPLRRLAQESMQETIDRALDDGDFRKALRSPALQTTPGSKAATTPFDTCFENCMRVTDRSKNECFDACKDQE